MTSVHQTFIVDT